MSGPRALRRSELALFLADQAAQAAQFRLQFLAGGDDFVLVVDDAGGHQDDEFGLGVRDAGGTKSGAEKRDVAQEGDAAALVDVGLLDDSGDSDGGAVLDRHLRGYIASVDRR